MILCIELQKNCTVKQDAESAVYHNQSELVVIQCHPNELKGKTISNLLVQWPDVMECYAESKHDLNYDLNHDV